MSKRKAINATFLTAGVLGGLALVNVISLGLFGRLDLTRDEEFTLSKATGQTLGALADAVTVQAYFTRDLPPPYATNARYVKDLLEEYRANSGGRLTYEFIDPAAEETDKDKEKKKEVKQDIFGRQVREETSVEKELRELGITPVQVRVNESDKLEVKRAFMGIVVRQGERKEVIPVVTDTAGLEYNLTTSLRKVSRKVAPKIALLTGHQGPEPREKLQRLLGLLGQLYEVTPLDLSQKAEIPADVNAILVIGPKTPFSEAEQRAIDQFVMSGRSAAFLLGPVAVELRKLESTPLDHGLSALLASYGVELQQGLVLDTECANLTVGQNRGFVQVNQQVHYPYMPMPKSLDPKHPLTRGLSEAAFPFMGPLAVRAPEGVKAEVLVTTSAGGWVTQAPFNLDPFQRWTQDRVGEQGVQSLLAVLSGPIKSHFGGQAVAISTSTPAKAQADNARVLVSNGYGFVLDEFMTKGNEALALNVLDWLVQDDALLAVRTRGLSAAPIDDKISDGKRNALKYLNIVGLPLLLVGFGLVRWRLREARRSSVSL